MTIGLSMYKINSSHEKKSNPLTAWQDKYDQKLSQTRLLLENAFGLKYIVADIHKLKKIKKLLSIPYDVFS